MSSTSINLTTGSHTSAWGPSTGFVALVLNKKWLGLTKTDRPGTAAEVFGVTIRLDFSYHAY